jgi:hypothetical protein
MKKWVEYQLKNQVKEMDWDYAQYPTTNISKVLPFFNKLEEGYLNGAMQATFENVFIDPAYIRRTAATTNGEVSEEQFRAWLSEYFDLVSGHGHKYIRDFGEHSTNIINTIANGLDLDPATTKVRLQIEEPGHYFMMHIDRHIYKEWEVEDGKEYTYDKLEDFHKHSIYIMFCKDWAQGQVFQLGNNFLKWKAGDIFHWDYRNVPHGTCNFGYETNFVFVITGNRKGK